MDNMTEFMQKLKKNLALIVGLSVLMIPTGLLLWLIFSWGWKVSIAALIIGITTSIIYFAADKGEPNDNQDHHDMNELTITRKRIIANYEQGNPITQGIKDYDVYRLALDK